ncbi:MAG: DUF4013 domain-containing protein [Myxococcota bacterium]
MSQSPPPTSPYAPPQTALYDERIEHADKIGRTERLQVDIGEAIGYPFQSPQWWQVCLMLGLFSLVPFVGVFHGFGYARRIFEAVNRGETQLPPLETDGLVDDIKDGFWVFLAWFFNLLPVLIPTYVLMFGGIVLIDTELETVGFVLFSIGILFSMVSGLLLNVIVPEAFRRLYQGERNIIFNPGPSIRAARSAPGPLLLTILGGFCAGAIGSMGVFACYFGMLFTFPLAAMINAHFVAQWSQVVRTTAKQAEDESGPPRPNPPPMR